jgi:LytS/YehU family sensor histidine kinase
MESRRRLRDERLRNAQLETQLAQSQLQALRMQLQPHFLFNTLNALSALVERDPRGVRRMISRLSELLRYNIEGSEEQEIPLRQELQWIGRYLEIMEVRFQGRLDVRTSVSDAALGALVPNLILQPLVENAIKHGVARALGPSQVEIEAEVSEGQTILRVRDSGAGEGAVSGPPPESGDPGSASGSGVGLRNTVARLEQLYGQGQSFELRHTETGGTLAEVRLPYHTRSDLHVAGVPAAR